MILKSAELEAVYVINHFRVNPPKKENFQECPFESLAYLNSKSYAVEMGGCGWHTSSLLHVSQGLSLCRSTGGDFESWEESSNLLLNLNPKRNSVDSVDQLFILVGLLVEPACVL